MLARGRQAGIVAAIVQTRLPAVLGDAARRDGEGFLHPLQPEREQYRREEADPIWRAQRADQTAAKVSCHVERRCGQHRRPARRVSVL